MYKLMRMIIPLQKQILIVDSVSDERFLMKLLCKRKTFQDIRKNLLIIQSLRRNSKEQLLTGLSTLHAKNELNWEQHDNKIDAHKHLCGININVLLGHFIQESAQKRQFRYLPETYCNSPCQLSVLTSQSLCKIMISAANLLVDTHQLHFNDEMIATMIFYA